MKVKELIALLQQQDQEAIVTVCGMDGAGYVAVSEVERLRLVKIDSCCGDFEEESYVAKSKSYKALGDPFDAVFLD